MYGQSIINAMMQKAQEAQDAGDLERASYWLTRAGEVEESLRNKN